MKSKVVKKSIAILMFIILIISAISNIVLAKTEISEAYIQDKGECGLHLQYWNEEKNAWHYIVCHYVAYEDNGKEYPAYCLNREYPRSRRKRTIYS